MADRKWQMAVWRRQLESLELLLKPDDEEIGDVTGFLEEMTGQADELPTSLDVQVSSLARELAEAYLRAEASERSEMRALVGGYPGILEELVSEAEFLKRKVQTRGDSEELRAALAMLVLNDQQADWREFLVALGALCDAAEKSGISIVPVLDEFIGLSSTMPLRGRISTAQVFTDARDARAHGFRRKDR